MTTCKICDGKTDLLFTREVLQRHQVDYFQCRECRYVCTEEPHWLAEAYAKPINRSDTGIVVRNEVARHALCFLLRRYFGHQGPFLDYAGGYGLLTRMMRDHGFHFTWSDAYTQNLFANGFEAEAGKQYQALSCCECFEHYVDPVSEVEKMLKWGRNIFFTTRFIPDPAPAPEAWDYYGFSHGQHVSFYTPSAVRALAERFGLRFASGGKNFHFIGEADISPLRLRLAESPVAKLVNALMAKRDGTLVFKDWEACKELDADD